jgi:hypothetical protein
MIVLVGMAIQNLGAFLARSAKNRAFRSNLFCGRGRKKGFPLQSLALLFEKPTVIIVSGQ